MELIRKKDEIKYKGDRSGEGVGDNIEGGRGGGGYGLSSRSELRP